MKSKLRILMPLLFFAIIFLTSCNFNTIVPTKEKYFVGFVVDGETTFVQVKDGDTVTPPEDPVKEGYTFVCWTRDGVPFDLNTPITKATYLHPKFEINEYTLAIQIDDGKTDDIVLTYKYGEKIDNISLPYNPDYDYAGYDQPIPSTMPAENIVRKVIFGPATRWIRYICDGVAIMTTTVKDGEEFTLGTGEDIYSPSLQVVDKSHCYFEYLDEEFCNYSDGDTITYDFKKNIDINVKVHNYLDSFEYTYSTSDLTIVITGYNYKDHACGIDEYYKLGDGKTYTVKSIEDNAFKSSTLRAINLPNTLEKIGANAFKDSSLRGIHLPDNLTDIGISAFENTKLEFVSFGNGVTKIPGNAFKNCDITEVKFTDSLKEIGAYAFYGCNMEEIKLPKNIKKIDVAAFAGCPFKSIELPEGLEYIGGNAFSGAQITTLTIPDSVTSLGALHIETLVSIKLGKGIDEICEYCFYELENLEEITISSNIKSIGNDAFWHCYKLTKINVTSLSSLASVVLKNGGKSEKLNVFYNYYDLYCNDVLVENLVIPSDIEELSPYAFRYCKSITSIVVPENITKLEAYSFEYMPSLRKVTFTSSLKEIGDCCFIGCEYLEQVTLLEGLEVLGNNVFEGCSSLIRIKLPQSLVKSGTALFKNCERLTYLTMLNWNQDYEGEILDGCVSIRYISLPDTYNGKSSVRLTRHKIGISGTWLYDVDFDDYHYLFAFKNDYKNVGGLESYWSEFTDKRTRTYNNEVEVEVNYDAITYEPYGSRVEEVATTCTFILFMPSNYQNLIVRIGEDIENLIDEDQNTVNTKRVAVGSTKIAAREFANDNFIMNLYIPSSVTEISEYALLNCEYLHNIYFDGTIDEWNKIVKKDGWNSGIYNYLVYCTDGVAK